jgi:hypothetical protein
MQPTKELIDDIYRDKVIRARRMKPEAKIHAGFELFETVRQRMIEGLRAENPEANESAIRNLFARRLAILRKLSSPHAS